MAENQFEISQAAGIVRDSQGFAFIPATQRPDGTWRKARRVKEGYVPDEDVERYKNKAARNRANAPACPGLGGSSHGTSGTSSNERLTLEKMSLPQQVPVVDARNLSKSAKKNLKRKEQRLKKKDEDMKASIVSQYQTAKSEGPNGDSTRSINQQLANVSISSNSGDAASTDLNKKIKNLKKKLRQIQELKEKIDSGTIPNPDKTQLEKVGRQEELEVEVRELEKQV